MDSGSSEDESSNDGENSKKRQNSDSSGSEQRASKKTRRMTHSSSSSDSDSGGEDSGKGEEISVKPASAVTQAPPAASDGHKSDLEEGQLSSDSGDENEDESSSDSEFDDGYGKAHWQSIIMANVNNLLT